MKKTEKKAWARAALNALLRYASETLDSPTFSVGGKVTVHVYLKVETSTMTIGITRNHAFLGTFNIINNAASILLKHGCTRADAITALAILRMEDKP